MTRGRWTVRSVAAALFAAVVLIAIVAVIQGVLPGGSGPKPLTWTALRNATYPTSVDRRGVTLHDGVSEAEAAPGSASKIIVRLADFGAFGRLDGDELLDAAVVLTSTTGGTGTFVELAAVRNDAGVAHPVASALLGDRILVREVRIQDGRILVRLRSRGATDPFSLRTREITRHYALDGDRLVQVDESEAQVQAAPADDFVYRPERLDVVTGGTSHVGATLAPGQIASYVVHGRAGERLALTVRSEFDNAVLSVGGLTDATTLVSRQEYAVDRSLVLPSEQDYAVRVVTLAGQPLGFALDVSLRAATQASAAPRPTAEPLPSKTPAPVLGAGTPNVSDRVLKDGSAAAAAFALTRPPVWGVAAYVPSRGVIYTQNADTQVPTASVVKALVMLVVLDQARQDRRPPSEDELALLWPMITESDNDATTQLWERIGRGQAIGSYLRSIGVVGFTPDPASSWGVSFVSARAMAMVLGKLLAGEILDEPSRTLAMKLLDSVVPAQRWGVAAGTDAEHGDHVGLKNGWYPGDEGWRVNSVGIVRPRDGAAYAIAIVTDQRASFEEGIATIEGIARAIKADLRGLG